MNPPHGKAPVVLSDLTAALQTGLGGRPKPAGALSEAMRTVPVEVQLIARDGTILTLPASEWGLVPWTRSGRDAEGKPVEIPQRARFTVCAVLPAGYLLVTDAPPAPVEPPAEPLPQVPWTQAPPGAPIPELAGFDPAVLASDTTKPAGHYDKTGDASANKGDAP